MMPAFATPDSSTVDRAEVDKFSRIAAQWWDEKGPFAPLHRLNPLRMTWIRDRIVEHFLLPPDGLKPFTGLRIVDVGCGGGLTAEPLARLGASVTGLDADGEAIKAAQDHATAGGLSIEYRNQTSDQLEAEQFDVVIALEIVEHVADVEAFVASLKSLLKPGGLLLMSTLNRTSKSFLAAIVGAEFVLRWLPRGTHDWRKFMKPSELARVLRRHHLEVVDLTGLVYSPVSRTFSLNKRDVDVNYLISAT